MNSKKGKGKNKSNKPPNPNPPQKTEDAKSPDKAEDPVVDKAESEIKIEERVPEIISDIVPPIILPSEDSKSVEEPKKPKRNRGKKKKHEKDELEESGDDKTVEKVEEEVKLIPAPDDENKVEVIEDKSLEQPKLDVPTMTPSARKKKNKNKNPNVEQQIKITENISKIEEPKEELSVEANVSNVDIKCDVLPKPTEDEIKPAKKKNKKKKRHDSEKSDKTEEISCTSAFQQLLAEEVEKQDTKNSVSESKIESIPEVMSEFQTHQLKQDIIEENVTKENKNKKKGKKEKHAVSTADIKGEIEHPVEKEKVSILSDIIPQDISAEGDKVIEERAPEEIRVTSEDQEKTKAKIAKPVDKKRKEKSNQALKQGELAENIIIQEIPKSEEIPTSNIKESLQEQSKCEEICFENKAEELKEFASTSESNLPHMEKKRKKSPKPHQKQDPKGTGPRETENEEIKSKDEITDERETRNKETIITQIQEQSTIEDIQKCKILETPVAITTEPECTKESLPHASTTTTSLEVKSGKKRKKSPKPMTKLEITEEKKDIVKETETTKETKTLFDSAKDLKSIAIPVSKQGEEKTDLFCDMPLMEEIEISSIKADESEGSVVEIMPDIQHPRASSQQRVDDNNNTIIREVVSPSDVKLSIPVFVPDTPFIQEEGNPLTSPELVASGIRIIDVEANVVKPTEEKTDIKSKMMEVNQDMEELRLSIERSLAELTCIEKTEENIESQFENKNKMVETKSDYTSITSSQMESKSIGEESQITESPILMIEKKPMDALMAVPSPPPKSNKKQKQKMEESLKPSLPVIPLPPPLPKKDSKPITEETKIPETDISSDIPAVPARKDNKGKGKSKKKGKQETGQVTTATESSSSSSATQCSKENVQDSKQEEKKEQKPDNSQDNTKKQSDNLDNKSDSDEIPRSEETSQILTEFEPIENFEDAMTSSLDDVNQTFEMIANESAGSNVNPEINITAPTEESKSDTKDVKQNPVTPPKNLLGHPVIPVRSNKMDYKKEKNKTPNTILAKVKIKDSIEIESKKQSKECQTDNLKKLMKKKAIDESISSLNENEEFVYKYSFRKVFLPNVCHVCKKELKPLRVSCSYCHLLFYCSQKHKDEDWPQHQAFCFAVSTIVHLKGQKHIYEDAATITGHNYRLLRMQMIVSCEKILKRKLVPWEQEALLYPRVCGDVQCREWRLNKLADCDGCGQISYCSSVPDHLPSSHQRWCKSYSLYQKLVCYQQTQGRLEPKLPGRVITGYYQVPDKINEVLAAMYEEKIDMNDVQYAALTQLATAPLTAVYSFQVYTNKMNAIYANGTYKKTSFTIHVIGAELQFEADALNKWEVFFLHLRPDITELRVCLIAPDLNPSNLPLDLLGKIRLCAQCRQDNRRVLFSFQDKMTYSEYYRSDDFITPDIVCAFNPSIQRSSVFNGKDPWPAAINCILKQKIPFIVTSYTLDELRRDLTRIKECTEFNIISDPKYNNFASVRPDRNFISDDEIPLLFKNYCFAIISGVF
ncbi:titin [Plodia interpunctella]|uniref:titin n=1 Tax=Plodia interpunctella TaxID=58824 RepID=UPI002368461C|nr:titin [Plodia interpunctella]